MTEITFVRRRKRAAAEKEKKRLKKLKEQEAFALKEAGQRRVRLAARKRTVVTNPLGLSDEGLS